MDMKETIRLLIQELVVPELRELKQDNVEIKTELSAINRRLDDVNSHLVDQSRRIDGVREELMGLINETNKRIDETNERLNRLYEVIVRREEHDKLEARLAALERDVQELTRRVACHGPASARMVRNHYGISR